MKTNIVSLPEGKYGKLVGDALYCCSGTCQEDMEVDIANVYMLLDGTLIAEAYGTLFPVKETNWREDFQLYWKYNAKKKRGHHSRVAYEKRHARIKPIEIDELPF